jgi:hypothetical protein
MSKEMDEILQMIKKFAGKHPDIPTGTPEEMKRVVALVDQMRDISKKIEARWIAGIMAPPKPKAEKIEKPKVGHLPKRMREAALRAYEIRKRQTSLF